MREFTTDQGNIIVKTNSDDTTIFEVVNVENYIPNDGLISLIEIKNIEDFKNIDGIDSLESFLLEKKILKDEYSIFAIPQFDYDPKDPYFETFLIKTNNETLIFDSHYGDSFQMKKFKTINRNLKGIWIDSNFDIEYAESFEQYCLEQVEINIPKDSLIYNFHPEYMKLIALNKDLTKGITTISFGVEPSIDTIKEDLIPMIDETEFEEVSEYDDEDTKLKVKRFKKLYKTYDFVNMNM